MKTEILKINNETLRKAADILNNGGLVAFPTETVYGLGTLINYPESINKIYEIKNRSIEKPLSIMVSDFRQLGSLINIDKQSLSNIKKLYDKFLPGPLTMVLPKSDLVSDSVTAGLNTVGIRIPADFFVLDLINSLSAPLVATSINLSGNPPATDISEVKELLDGKVDLIIDGGKCRFEKPSTVVDLAGKTVEVLREGVIPEEKIMAALFPEKRG